MPSLFTLQNINKIEIDDGSGTPIGVCGITGGVSIAGTLTTTGALTANDTLLLSSGSITDSTNSIDFGSNSLTTTGGTITGDIIKANSTGLIGTIPSQMAITGNDITSGTGNINFGAGGDTISFNSSGVNFTFPTSDGNPGEVLTTNGARTLTFASSGGGGGGATSIDDLSDAVTNSTTVILGNETAAGSTSGTNSVAVGISAGFNSLALTDSVMLGFNAGNVGNTFQDFIGIGTGVASTNAGGLLHQNSVAIGTCALTSLQSTGTSGNTAIGFEAGKLLQDSSFNTFIGHQAGDNVTTGTNVTCIGSGADASTPAIGNEVTLGNGSVTKLRCATQTIASISDSRDKTNVTDLQYGIDFIENIRPVEFTWERRPIHTGDQENPTNGTRKTGFLAQELLEAMPDGENEILDLVCEENPERLEAKYNNLIPVLVKAVKDLKAEVDTLKQRMDNCSC